MSKEFEEIVLKKLDALEMKTDVLEKEISGTNKVVREIQQDFAKFDYEINTKIDTLFDAYTVNQEKHIFFRRKDCFFRFQNF